MTKKTKTPSAREKSGRRKKELRESINVTALIEALERHVLGEREMTATQVSAALALLKKTLPDMTESALKDAKGPAATAHEDALLELE